MRVRDHQLRDQLTDTRAFYDQRAAQYAEATLSQSMERWLMPFTAKLSVGARIVDLGCGGGRDLKVLRAAGYESIGLDRSEALAKIATRYSGAPVVVADLCELPFADGIFDGTWAAASYLHVPRALIASAFKEAHRVLSPASVLFASFKRGRGEVRDTWGRQFTLFEPDELRAALVTANFTVLSTRVEQQHAVDAEWGGGQWISCLATKQ